MIDMHKEIEMIHSFLPHAQTIAVIYNNAEANSIVQVQQIHKELAALNIAVIDVGIAQESDIPSALALASRKADAIICPTDNMVASAMELVATIAYNNKKPLFACHNQAVAQGALAARGVDYTENGTQAAQVAYAILIDGKKTL